MLFSLNGQVLQTSLLSKTNKETKKQNKTKKQPRVVYVNK